MTEDLKETLMVQMFKTIKQLKTVVFPAPLGPIIDVIWSFFAEKDRSSIAINPPNFIVKFSTLSNFSLIKLFFFNHCYSWLSFR